MALEDIRILFLPKTNEYVVVSEGNYLRLSEEEFHAVRTNMNGIGIALAERARRRRLESEGKKEIVNGESVKELVTPLMLS